MFVVKRDGRTEQVAFDKITARIKKLSYGLNTDFCDPVRPGQPELTILPRGGHTPRRLLLGTADALASPPLPPQHV